MIRRKIVEALKIIEVPYDETKPMWEVRYKEENGKLIPRIKSYLTFPQGRRELHDYNDCGVYLTAGVPYDVTRIVCNDTDRPHETQNVIISQLVKEGLKEKKCVVMTGGGCGHTIGMMGGVQQGLGSKAKIGFIWWDAHADFNTPETTESGLVGGTPLATIAGFCKGEDYENWMKKCGLSPIPNENIILTDARDSDPGDEINLANSSLRLLNTEQYNDEATWRKAVEDLAAKVDYIYFHIDEDILDAKYTPGQYTETPNGPEIDVAMRNIKIVMETEKVVAFSLVSVFHENDNPAKELCTLNGMRIISAAFRNWKYCPEF